MGTSTSWIAVKGATLDQVARALGLAPAPSGSISSAQDDGGYQAAVLPPGWIVLARKMERDGVVADRGLLKELSGSWQVVGCDEESHVMYSASSEWRDGREVWSVVHSSEEAADHLAVKGEPPAGWLRVRSELFAKQAQAERDGGGVDYVYEVPLAVAELVAGYGLESDVNAGLEWVTLVAGSSRRPSTGPSKPWWKLW